jgi:hypothetical protein
MKLYTKDARFSIDRPIKAGVLFRLFGVVQYSLVMIKYGRPFVMRYCLNTLCMYRTKVAIARNTIIALLLVTACFFLFPKNADLSAFRRTVSSIINNPSFRMSSGRVCPDPSQPDYFQKLALSTGVNASKQS